MTRVFVNGISSKSAGGLSILTNFLKTASANQDSFEYVVATPSITVYEAFNSDRIQIVPLGWRSRASLVPVMSISYLPKVAKKFGCDLIFNLSDIPLKTELPQVFLFDWPYAIYPDSIVWSRMSWFDHTRRTLKLGCFKRLLRNVDIAIAQSNLVREKIETQYGFSDSLVIPNIGQIDKLRAHNVCDFGLGDGVKCLFLSRYYSHKNFEILIPLAEIIKERNYETKIIITLDQNDSQRARKFLSSIKEKKLDGVVQNIGPVPLDQVFNLFNQVDALLMPTLLETMGLTYLEAMHCGKLVFTSDLAFAHAVCGDAAIYFDPLDAYDIISKIRETVSSPDIIKKKIKIGKENFCSYPDWQDTYLRYLEGFQRALGKKNEH